MVTEQESLRDGSVVAPECLQFVSLNWLFLRCPVTTLGGYRVGEIFGFTNRLAVTLGLWVMVLVEASYKK